MSFKKSLLAGLLVLSVSPMAWAAGWDVGEKLEAKSPDDGKWYVAKVVKTAPGKYFVHYDGYKNDEDEWLPESALRNFYAVGSKEVEAKAPDDGKWYPATILKVNGDKFFVHYVGYKNNEDEWLERSKLRMKGD